MESDLDEAELRIRDVVTPSPRLSAERNKFSRFIAPTSPLTPGYQLPFFAPYCYSPHGTSLVAQQSRLLRDHVKRADRTTLARCAARVAAMAAAEIAPHFLNRDAVLIPVPQSAPYDFRNPISAPVAIARALQAAGIGKCIWPALRRWRAVPKSAWARPGSRPEFMDHYTSLELLDHVPPASQLLLIDDFVTRGRTFLAAAAVLAQAFPHAHIQALALIRIQGLTRDIAAIITPTTGVIRYVGGDALRSP